MSDLFSMIMKIKHIKGKAIGITIGVVFLLIIFPIMSVFFEDSVTSEIIGNYGVVGTPISEGGNDYREIKEGSEEEKALIEYLEQSGLWNTSIAKSREAQALWYMKLSKMLEETYIDGQESKNSINIYAAKDNYKTNTNCIRATKSDYANEECNTNGNVSNIKNYSYFVWEADGSKIKKTSCKEYDATSMPDHAKYTPIYTYATATKRYYSSYESRHIPGGKIVGLYPDILVATAIGNTYSTFDQNRVEEMEELEKDQSQTQAMLEQTQKVLGAMGIYTPVVNIIRNTIKLWLDYATVIASSNDALKDTFSEGSLYSTFHFYPESSCTVTDVVAYEDGPDKFPMGHDEDGNEKPYDCVRSKSGYTKCNECGTVQDCPYCGEETYACPTEEDPNKTCTRCATCTIYCAEEYKNTDGNVNTYYWVNSKEHNIEVSSTIPDKTKTFRDGVGVEILDEGTGKYCDLLQDTSDNKIYQVSVKWVCIPNKPKENDPQITCEVSPVKDKLGRILYYECTSISESEVRKKIVDPILDAYENNQTDKVKNEYMTTETANKYINGFDESKYDLNSINPNGYTIDETTRNIITKHIVNEILGRTEGRKPAIATKEGYFYLNSYNRVLNKDQYKDALLSTLFVKDDLILKAGKDANFAEKLGLKDEKNLNNRKYSHKLYGVFYSEYNSDFDDWSSEKIEQQMKEDKSRKNSLIMEIFDTYDYLSKNVSEKGYIGGGISGSGLAQADSSGYRIRNQGPTSQTGYYSSGLFGECAWYATGRIKEILANAGSNYDKTLSANGGDFCILPETNDFKQGTDYRNPKVGAVISWSGGLHLSGCSSRGCGHVAIIEKVYYDESGKATHVDISEGGLGFSGYSHSALSDGIITRQKACGTGKCFKYREHVPVDFLKNYGNSNYRFVCYIYLLKDEKQNTSTSDDTKTEDKNDLNNNNNNISDTTTEKPNDQISEVKFTPRLDTEKDKPPLSGYWDLGQLWGECPWYAYGRVKEILAESGSPYGWNSTTNGNGWCSLPDASNFKISTNYREPKPGSIVSWSKGKFGHVAIVEKVDTVNKKVTISESYIGLGKYKSQTIAENMVYSVEELGADGVIRRRKLDIYNSEKDRAIALQQGYDNCRDNSCFQTRTLTYDQMYNSGWNGYTFNCYIYLLNN